MESSTIINKTDFEGNVDKDLSVIKGESQLQNDSFSDKTVSNEIKDDADDNNGDAHKDQDTDELKIDQNPTNDQEQIWSSSNPPVKKRNTLIEKMKFENSDKNISLRNLSVFAQKDTDEIFHANYSSSTNSPVDSNDKEIKESIKCEKCEKKHRQEQTNSYHYDHHQGNNKQVNNINININIYLSDKEKKDQE